MTSETQTPARVRFAPSPTGFLHLGGLRTALFNWLYARHTGGQFILRIEDTDQKRYDPNSLQDLMAGLRWLGLEWDEGPDKGGDYGPYVQSERQELYSQYAEQLIASGHAYRCYCTAEDLEAMREEQRAKGLPMGYNGRHRNISAAERAELEASGLPSVIRLAVPQEGTTVVNDLIRGDIAIENDTLLDPVLVKSDGMPTYHFAVVVDDHLMEITHIIRGEEWISSAPLHKLLYDAFGWEMPTLVHLPVILDPSGKGKMSKRKKVVAGKEYLALVHEFIDAGYLPEAMFNFLTNVGWNYDPSQEVFEPEQAIERFDVKDINPTSAALPYPKLEWLNGLYIRELAPAALHARLAPYIAKESGIDEAVLRESEKLANLVPLIQERIKLLTEAWDKIDWAFVSADAIKYPEPKLLIGKGLDAEQTLAILRSGAQLLRSLEPFTTASMETEFREAAVNSGVKVGSFFAPFRVAITGRNVSPPLFESMEVLGQAETVTRVENAAAALQSHVAAMA